MVASPLTRRSGIVGREEPNAQSRKRDARWWRDEDAAFTHLKKGICRHGNHLRFGLCQCSDSYFSSAAV